jgi:hypothetical protein
MKRLAVSVIKVGTRGDPVIRENPASDLGLARAAVIGVRIAAESSSAEFFHSNTLKRLRARQPRDVSRRDTAAAGSKPCDPVVRVRDNPVAVIRRGLVPQVEGRMREGHATIVSLGTLIPRRPTPWCRRQSAGVSRSAPAA